jgi:hypothetical protein
MQLRGTLMTFFTRTRARALGVLLALCCPLAGLSASAVPAHADAVWSGVCQVTMTIDFEGWTVTTSPGFVVPYTITGQGTGNCTGTPSNSSMTFGGWGVAQVVSCDYFHSTGAATYFTFNPTLGSPGDSQANVGVGPWTAQQWVFPGVRPEHFDAVGDFVLNGANQLNVCTNSGVGHFDLKGALVYQDPVDPAP